MSLLFPRSHGSPAQCRQRLPRAQLLGVWRAGSASEDSRKERGRTQTAAQPLAGVHWGLRLGPPQGSRRGGGFAFGALLRGGRCGLVPRAVSASCPSASCRSSNRLIAFLSLLLLPRPPRLCPGPGGVGRCPLGGGLANTGSPALLPPPPPAPRGAEGPGPAAVSGVTLQRVLYNGPPGMVPRPAAAAGTAVSTKPCVDCAHLRWSLPYKLGPARA